MYSEFTYRSPTLADKEELKQLAWLSYGQYSQYMTLENAHTFKNRMYSDVVWDSILSTAKGFICEYQGKIIGMAFLIPSGNPWDIFKSEWSYIRMVGVDPNFEGNGIATRLMKQCIDYAISINETTIALHTSEKMSAARHIYEKLGFKILQEIEPRLGLRYWIYTLTL